MKKKTHKQFLKDLRDKNEAYRDGLFTIIDQYRTAIFKLRLYTKYGVCKMSPNALLAGKNPCTIASSVNKTDYAKSMLFDKNKYYRKNQFEIITEYKGFSKKVKTIDNYGVCEMNFSSLYMGSPPTLQSAVNKTKYWLSKIKKDYPSLYEKYEFEKTEIKGTEIDTIITCKIHGDFNIRPSNFTSKNQGCQKCFEEKFKDIYKNNGGWTFKHWVNKSIQTDFFKGYCFYTIRCYNNNESFYKVGITFRGLKDRFKNLPYSYEIVKELYSEDPLKIYCLEKVYKRVNEKYKYTPKIYFGGQTECFSKIEEYKFPN